MTENPYEHFARPEELPYSVSASALPQAWNEGYNQAIEDALKLLPRGLEFNILRAKIPQLRKKVSE